MKQRGVGIALALALMLAPQIARAGQFKVHDLLGYCKEPIGSTHESYCFGLIDGAAIVMKTTANIVRGGVRRVLGLCDYGTATGAAEKKAFVDWAEAHPQYWGWEEGNGVMEALSDAWPCHGETQ